jgi:hypothetical protein
MSIQNPPYPAIMGCTCTRPWEHPVKACTKNIGSFPRCYFCFIGIRAELGRIGSVAGLLRERSSRRFVACFLHNPRTKKVLPHSWSRRSGPLVPAASSHSAVGPLRENHALFRNLPEFAQVLSPLPARMLIAVADRPIARSAKSRFLASITHPTSWIVFSCRNNAGTVRLE